MLSRETLVRFLEDAGLSPVTADASSWTGRLPGDASRIPVTIRLSENWLLFRIVGRVPSPRSEEDRRAQHDRLLRLNRDVELAKFCLDDAGQVLVTAELPTESLNDSEVRDAVNALAACIERAAG